MKTEIKHKWIKDKRASVCYFDDEDQSYSFFYHNTCIVRWNDNTVQLSAGGWLTKTTKIRMREVADFWDLGFTIYQKTYQWYVQLRCQDFLDNNNLKFFDGMVFTRHNLKNCDRCALKTLARFR